MGETLTPTQRLAGHLLGAAGPLEDFVRTRRSAGRSWRLIARDLYEQTNGAIDVTYETLRSWYVDEPVEPEAPGSAA